MTREDEDLRHFKMSPVTDLPQTAPEVRRVTRAGNGLILTGVAGLLLNCLLNFGSLLLALATPPGALRDVGMPVEAIDPAAAERGRAAAPLLQTCAIAVPTLMVYPLAILGGLRMKQFRNYRLAVASAIAVMLPCSCAFLLGLPVGVWALRLLCDPNVTSKFR